MVLLLVPRWNHQPGTGHVRIEVGQGLEGIVTDAAAGQIRRDVMGPLLAQEEYGPALPAGVARSLGLIARGYGGHRFDAHLARADAPRPRAPSPQFVSLLPLLLFILFIIAAPVGRRPTAPRILGRPVDRRRRVAAAGGVGGGGGGGFGGFGGGGGFSGGGSGGRF